ncbi:MAG: hypothetical protein K2J20_01865 [Bacilli bacterium]|nr:hypothetical protein [Bacilli bacterium]
MKNLFVKSLILISICLCIFGFNNVQAKEKELPEDNTVYYEDVFNTGKDNGYSKKYDITKDDPHYGWKIGKFAISGFSSKKKDDKGNWVLLKNVGDEIALYFNLYQNIDKLNGVKNLFISTDKNGYDNEFKIQPTNFGRGTLIVRKIDATGNKNEPVIYTDYLKKLQIGDNTKIKVYEEGDYEVALDYEIKENGFAFFDSYHNYRIRFNFSIRNGNCMIYPFDIKTKEELRNTSITENGFYIDLANSKYLDVNIKREVLKDGADGLVEDTRYNRPAKSGDEFTEEGVYTITVKNNYTNETTTKKIYVGKNPELKAHVQTGRSIENIRLLVNEGAKIDEDGNLTNIPKKYQSEYSNGNGNANGNNKIKYIIPILVPILLVVIFLIKNIKKQQELKELAKKKLINKKKYGQDKEENNNEI